MATVLEIARSMGDPGTAGEVGGADAFRRARGGDGSDVPMPIGPANSTMTRAGGGTTPGSGREEATRQRFWLSSGTFHEAGRLSGAIGGLTATGFGRERIAVVGQRPALDRFEAERRALLPAGPQGEADPDFFAVLGDLVVAGLGGASEALYGTRGPLVQSLFPAPPGPRHAEAGQRWLGSDFATHWQARLATGAVILVASALDLIGQRLATRVLLAHCLDDIETHDFVL